MQDQQDLRNEFDGASKISYLCAKFCAIEPKMKKILKKILRFFDQNLYGKLTFFTFFTKYFLDFDSSPKVYTPLKDNIRFLQQFFRFRGGGDVPAFPLPTLLKYHQFLFFLEDRSSCFGYLDVLCDFQ